jgi:cytochrome c-type biogenesis protein CcmH/NrfF
MLWIVPITVLLIFAVLIFWIVGDDKSARKNKVVDKEERQREREFWQWQDAARE